MGRIIADAVQGDFHPLVSIRSPGNFVKGKVVAKSITANGNPVLTISLIDLDGSVQESVSKGVYQEVEVDVGALVQIVGAVKQLREKLPQVEVGEIVTITFAGKKKLQAGRTLNQFTVEVN